MTPRVVAIDGAAGSGKSTLARALAVRLGLAYVNTGLLYRAVAAAALAAGVDPDDETALVALIPSLRFTLAGDEPPALVVEGTTDAELTTLEVEESVSAVARHPAVRHRLRPVQRELGGVGAVVEGRDIATVVFPDAPVKLFLTAAPVARASRRSEDREGPAERTGAALHARDARDARTNPLEPAPGAIVLDTGVLDEDATLTEALRVIHDLAPELAT
jgi:CMP/dCMP kinase